MLMRKSLMMSSNRTEYPSLGMALLLFQLLMRLILHRLHYICILQKSLPALVQYHVQMECLAKNVDMFDVCRNVDKGVTNFLGPLKSYMQVQNSESKKSDTEWRHARPL